MLTLPLLLAVAGAGAVGGVHCVGMCGGVTRLLGMPRRAGTDQTAANEKLSIRRSTIWLQAAIQPPIRPARWRHSFFLHAGRLVLYGLLGAIVGGMGAGSIWLLPLAGTQQVLFIGGNLALVLMGLRLLDLRLPLMAQLGARLQGFGWLQRFQQQSGRVLAQGQRHPFLLGMAWGCLPCGLLLAVLPFALFAGSVLAGAVLMLVFGLCSLPHLLLVQSAAAWGKRWHLLFALVLLGLGGFGLLHSDMQNMPAALCVTAR